MVEEEAGVLGVDDETMLLLGEVVDGELTTTR